MTTASRTHLIYNGLDLVLRRAPAYTTGLRAESTTYTFTTLAHDERVLAINPKHGSKGYRRAAYLQLKLDSQPRTFLRYQAIPSSLDSDETSAHDGESSKLYSPRHNDLDVAKASTTNTIAMVSTSHRPIHQNVDGVAIRRIGLALHSDPASES
ncbi:hypothetical protein D9611_014042 [Ephemerocybe angulata]|uniref:Uncharacterized protein n=1 Tax=Ephemerocybe angulata TaxID=980116 RepID=A0A8H5ERG4_9AGAR|nr:hypothetical protein D9611_014042 [Tulosesus angulatus]